MILVLSPVDKALALSFHPFNIKYFGQTNFFTQCTQQRSLDRSNNYWRFRHLGTLHHISRTVAV